MPRSCSPSPSSSHLSAIEVESTGQSVFDGDYEISRPPGNLPYEALAYVLDSVAGASLVVLASMVTGSSAVPSMRTSPCA